MKPLSSLTPLFSLIPLNLECVANAPSSESDVEEGKGWDHSVVCVENQRCCCHEGQVPS